MFRIFHLSLLSKHFDLSWSFNLSYILIYTWRNTAAILDRFLRIEANSFSNFYINTRIIKLVNIKQFIAYEVSLMKIRIPFWGMVLLNFKLLKYTLQNCSLNLHWNKEQHVKHDCNQALLTLRLCFHTSSILKRVIFFFLRKYMCWLHSTLT